MPVYNAVTTIRKAVNSVCQQEDISWELIIIDGGSTDGTVPILNEFSGETNIRWVSESDKGIYDAMNKGIDKATGEWLYFLGSDDQLADYALIDASKLLSSDYSVVFGDVVFDNNYRMRSYLGPRTWLQNTLHHQSAFYHRSLFDNFRYDSSLRLVADYELNLQVYQQKLHTYYTGKLIAICHSGGASSNWAQSLNETNIVRGRLLKKHWQQVLLSSLLSFYYSQKQLRRKLYGHKV